MTNNPDTIDAAFVNYIEKTIFVEEGDYSNDPDDAGGETCWGITIAIARQYGYNGPMRDLTQSQALTIYRQNDWIRPGYQAVAGLNLDIALEMLDLGINIGDSWPDRWLQMALSVLNYSGLWPNVEVDGDIGPATLHALQAFLTERGTEGVRVMKAIIRAFAGVRYVGIAQANATDKKYEWGWLVNRAFPASS